MLSEKQIKAIEETWGMKLEDTSREEKFKSPNYYLFTRNGERELPPFFPGSLPRWSSEDIEICFLKNENSLQINIDNMNLTEELMKLAKILEVK